MGRGDVRAAVLALLAEQPMHGYQIIREIEERSGGSWKPSAGSVYPTLQLLADEGLISAEESNGRKTYSLTDAGRDEADAAGDRSAPWETPRSSGPTAFGALPKAGIELAQAAAQVRPHRHRRSRSSRPSRCSTRRVVSSTRSSLRTDAGAAGTSASRRLDARRGTHARPLPPHPALRRLRYLAADVVVRAVPAAHRAREDRRRAAGRRGCGTSRSASTCSRSSSAA